MNLFRSCVFLLLSSLLSCSSTSKTIAVGNKAPFTRFAMMDGSFRTTEDFRGKNLLLVYWATTCARSHSVLDDVNQWVRERGRKHNLRVLSVSVDKASNEAKVTSTISSQKLSYLEHAFSGNDIYDEAYIAYDVGELPTLVLIDPYGKIIGSGTSTDVLDDAFRR